MSEAKKPIRLGTVQETLLIPLWARAVESSHLEAIVRDPLSAQMVERIDYDFGKLARSQKTQVGCCLRGNLFDGWVREFLNRNPTGTVVEIGAGLNTRFERVDNGQVHWFDLDLPDVMVLRQQFFSETDRRKFIVGSVLDPEWIQAVRAHSTGPYLFVIEAVLMYLREEQVKLCLGSLADHFPGALIAFDSLAARALQNQNKHDAMRYFSARFQWAIENVRHIRHWDPRFQVLEVKTFWDSPSSQRHRLGPWWIRFLYALPPLRETYRLCLLRIGE